jgi:hypothetical protein
MFLRFIVRSADSDLSAPRSCPLCCESVNSAPATRLESVWPMELWIVVWICVSMNMQFPGCWLTALLALVVLASWAFHRYAFGVCAAGSGSKVVTPDYNLGTNRAFRLSPAQPKGHMSCTRSGSASFPPRAKKPSDPGARPSSERFGFGSALGCNHQLKDHK